MELTYAEYKSCRATCTIPLAPTPLAAIGADKESEQSSSNPQIAGPRAAMGTNLDPPIISQQQHSFTRKDPTDPQGYSGPRAAIQRIFNLKTTRSSLATTSQHVPSYMHNSAITDPPAASGADKGSELNPRQIHEFAGPRAAIGQS